MFGFRKVKRSEVIGLLKELEHEPTGFHFRHSKIYDYFRKNKKKVHEDTELMSMFEKTNPSLHTKEYKTQGVNIKMALNDYIKIKDLLKYSSGSKDKQYADDSPDMGRREFLKGATATGIALGVNFFSKIFLGQAIQLNLIIQIMNYHI